MRFDIVTLFPDFFRGPFEYGILSRALRDGKLSATLHDLRRFTHDRHRTVDDRPFGGGEGMVLKPEPLFECVESLGISPKPSRDLTRESVILLSAAGTRFTQATARHLATLDRVVLLCGRYEGVDQRVPDLLCDRELSVGDFVLSGGELPAALIVDAVARLLPGVLGHADSSRYESFGESEDLTEPDNAENPRTSHSAANTPPRATHAAGGLLDYPHYTRPAVFRGVSVPDVLQAGDHKAVRQWRRQAALQRTLSNRPDLLANADLSAAESALLKRWAGEPE
jgi:tRNA (guanine37-N1)-methyltransferase